MKISVIIVHYKVKESLLACITSLKKSTGISYEIIVVDNDEKPSIEKEVKKFSDVRYVRNKKNTGYGAGNNSGSLHATGEYLFFLNPDTTVFSDTLRNLYTFAEKTKKSGAISPLLLGTNNKPYHQGEKLLTPLRGIFALSMINKIFPNNPISRDYLDVESNHAYVREIDVVPGTALLIKKKIFTEVGGFDEKFFLFFEEFDLCKRLVEKGFHNYIIPSAKVVHQGAKSTVQRRDTQQVFSRSRWYYFRKHFGVLPAIVVQVFTSIGKIDLLAGGIALLGLFLATYQVYNRAPFIGDQGWYYLSAKEMVTTGTIPLVGIASSHPWLHQGALWTYLLGAALWLGNFHPLAGVYLSIGIGFLTILSFYFVSKQIFGAKVSLIGTTLFAVSPEIVYSQQFAYHTAPLPLCIIWYMYTLFQILKGKIAYSIPAVVLLSLLYQLELFTVIFIPLLFLAIGFALQTKAVSVEKVQDKKVWGIAAVAFGISFFPVLLYDVQHGFPQTLGFVAWMGYSILKALNFFPATGNPASATELGEFFLNTLRKIIFYPSAIVASIILFVSSFALFSQLKRNFNISTLSYLLLLLWLCIPVAGILVTRTPSHAYVPVLYPAICLLCGIGFAKYLSSKFLLGGILGTFMLVNGYSSVITLPRDTNAEIFSLAKRVEAAQTIVDIADGKAVRLVGAGKGSEFRSFTMNYEYLIWWLGGTVTQNATELEFIITETPDGIMISQSSRYARMLQ